MNPKKLVKLSNNIGIFAIILLIYWVFIFITIQVFGLKVFKENITETFYLSILGILALMTGALIINIMFNLTRIAQKHNDDQTIAKSNKTLFWAFIISFPLISLGLFTGDFLTSKKKEKMLFASAKSMIETNNIKSDHLLNYKFEKDWILKTKGIIEIFSKTDEHFPYVTLIVKDSIDQEPLFLGFNRSSKSNWHDTLLPQKKDYIQQSTQEERDYFNSIFEQNNNEYRYSSHDGRYELFYPYSIYEKSVILYFSQYQQYGKSGF